MYNKASKNSQTGGTKMSIVLRPGTPPDAALCGPICFRAFKAINDEHHFPWDFPSADVATGVLTMLLSNPGFYSVVAEQDGDVVGMDCFVASRLAMTSRHASAFSRRDAPGL
jgi:hypothetical protein